MDAWRRGQNLVNHFRQTRKAQYLAALREKQRTTLNRKDPTTVQFPRVGDVVQIGNSTSEAAGDSAALLVYTKVGTRPFVQLTSCLLTSVLSSVP